MAACKAACERVGSPVPQMVRSALFECVVGDLRVVANMMSARRGTSKRQDLLDRIEQRIATCERVGTAIFSTRAVDNMIATSDLRPKAKAALDLKKCRARALAVPLTSTARAYPVSGKEVWVAGVLPPVQMTVREMFTRGITGNAVCGATSTSTLAATAASELPFYDVFGAWATRGTFNVTFGVPLVMDEVLAQARDEEYAAGTQDDNWRALLCFVAAPQWDATEPPVDEESRLAWPPSSATVRLNGRVVVRRGKAALPVDVTAAIRSEGGNAHLDVTRAGTSGILHGMNAVLIACRYDSASAGGDASHFLARNIVPVRAFAPKNDGQDDSIEIGFYRVPMTCPLSMRRIQVPIRSSTCNHAQCFDLGSHLMAGAAVGAPRWVCPICLEPAGLGKIEIDPVLQHAIEAGTRAKHIDLNETCTMWRGITDAEWHHPATERAATKATADRLCTEFWDNTQAVPSPPPPSIPIPTPRHHAPCLTQVQAGRFKEVVPRAFATASPTPDMGDAAMAFWMDLSQEGDDEGRDREASPPSHATDNEHVCVICGDAATSSPSTYTLCSHCFPT